MLYTITKNDMVVRCDTKGAEIVSVQSKGKEYIWQADPAFWVAIPLSYEAG